MTSRITFSGIKHTLIKSASDITKSERSLGKLNARSIINRFGPNLKIDVIVLKTLPTLIIGDTITFNEDDLRHGTRKTFTEKGVFIKSGTLHVKVDFFKKIEQGDTILILLHEI
jgi:hypothetical protein